MRETKARSPAAAAAAQRQEGGRVTPSLCYPRVSPMKRFQGLPRLPNSKSSDLFPCLVLPNVLQHLIPALLPSLLFPLWVAVTVLSPALSSLSPAPTAPPL
uniref:Macaca fascicularis brain cDNA, clone: QflA-19644 n=1 Tax=Macaca fascicularis TaxID=9541 RepID=I7GCL9_MACFA|nr:unnamed protein product [Macaca fascicularis]